MAGGHSTGFLASQTGSEVTGKFTRMRSLGDFRRVDLIGLNADLA
jgi:hypothetical protein